MKRITEQEYMRHEQERLRDFARLIERAKRDFEISDPYIAMQTGMITRTIFRARHHMPVRSDSEARIRLFIKELYKDSEI